MHSRTPLGVQSTPMAPGGRNMKMNIVLGGIGGNSANEPIA
jgi:hypothetical protein